MREILFRGKRTDNGEWAEGYLTRRPSAIQYGAHYSPWFIDTPPRDPDDSGGFYNVDGETVGQCTGLTDKNGKKIFEGDIVREVYGEHVYNEKLVVSMDTDRCGWFPFARGDGCGCCEYDTWALDVAEVIGNIHDNPELLKGE